MCDIVFEKMSATHRMKTGQSCPEPTFENHAEKQDPNVIKLDAFETPEFVPPQSVFETQQEEKCDEESQYEGDEDDDGLFVQDSQCEEMMAVDRDDYIIENPEDELVALQQTMLECERDIAIFAGAIELLNQQIDESSSNRCAVCKRTFISSESQNNCFKILNERILFTDTARQESGVLENYQSCIDRIASLRESRGMNHELAGVRGLAGVHELSDCSTGTPPVVSEPNLRQSRVVSNVRIGSLTELRNQKMECLAEQQCFACLRGLSGTEFANFLSYVDRCAARMEQNLHVHTK